MPQGLVPIVVKLSRFFGLRATGNTGKHRAKYSTVGRKLTDLRKLAVRIFPYLLLGYPTNANRIPSDRLANLRVSSPGLSVGVVAIEDYVAPRAAQHNEIHHQPTDLLQPRDADKADVIAVNLVGGGMGLQRDGRHLWQVERRHPRPCSRKHAVRRDCHSVLVIATLG